MQFVRDLDRVKREERGGLTTIRTTITTVALKLSGFDEVITELCAKVRFCSSVEY